MENNKVVKREIDAILADIIKEYNLSGKRTSGEFEEGLEAVYEINKVTIKGYPYLAGRKAGKMPPVEKIKNWIETKGIRPYEEKMTVSSLAWAIAKKIAKNGTNKEYHLKVYEKVITPERIDLIIKKVVQFNVNLFVSDITAEMKLLQKNI